MKKILTLVIDGIGISNEENGNALKKANMPNYNNILENYPHSELVTYGLSVGLPECEGGNAKVGYSTLSAGKILKQRSSFFHDFVDEDNLATNTELKLAIEQVKKKKSTFHIIGLMSSSAKNSNIDDIIKILEFLKKQEVNVGVDFIADGRDVETKSVLKYVEKIESIDVPIFTVCGRYYAMDEEEKWDRTKIYYDLVKNGIGLKVKELNLALKNCYIRNITDEFLPPIIVKPNSNIKDNDVVLWTNYNDEGALQILTALTNPSEITEFKASLLQKTKFMMMYPIDPKIQATVLINEEDDTSSGLGQYLSKLGLTQARIAGKNNYDYVTYYFNGETEEKLPKCINYLVDIEKKGTEIEAAAITKQIIKCMEKDTDFILASFSNIEDAILTENYENTIKALEYLDDCLGKIVESAEMNFYTIIILSTYASAEEMLNEENKVITSHTMNKAPFIITDSKIKLSDGILTDVAPTLLSYMDISIPESMKNSEVLIKN